MNLRRLMVVGALGALVLGFTSTSAMALSVQANTTVNGSAAPITVRLGTNASTRGTVTYDSSVGSIPIPLTGYFEQGVAYYPFGRPTASSGTQRAPFYYAISGPTGSPEWVMTTHFWVWGTYTASTLSVARADLRSGSSTVYYNYTGDGTCNCDIIENDYVRVYVA